MPRFAAIRRNRATFGKSDIDITDTAQAAAETDGSTTAVIAPVGLGAAAAAGDIALIGDASTFFAAATTLGDSTLALTSVGRAKTFNDTGFPYTFPIIFGGAPPTEGFGTATATVTITADATAAADGLAQNDISLLARGRTIEAGFPYVFPIIFGDIAGPRFPYTFPISL